MKVSLRLPAAYTILSVPIALVALGTWLVPASQYERAENPELDPAVPGSWYLREGRSGP